MREVFDELWIIDLEGDSLGTRKTENIFAIQIPVAIAIGVRNGPPNPTTPATVWKTRLTGLEQEKLIALDHTKSLEDYQWSQCLQGWRDPFRQCESRGILIGRRSRMYSRGSTLDLCCTVPGRLANLNRSQGEIYICRGKEVGLGTAD